MSEKDKEGQERLTRLLRVCGRRLYHSSCAGRTQARVLGLLAEGGMTQREIQERLQIQPGSVSELTGKLELKGFVTRARDERDRRRVALTLTPEGRRAQEAAAKRKDVAVRYDGLTEEERAQLAELLEKVIEGWRKDGVPENELTF
ncbi:MAG: MarR family transcriptional regulator [Clostridia bacterium]|nr:MarR family transcriptional regulator [Clostridia bacterium]